MKDKQKPWRIIALIAAILSGFRVAIGFFILLAERIPWGTELFQWDRGAEASIGIIGGADGPTAIFITSTFDWVGMVAAVGIFVVSLLILIRLYKKK